VNNCLRINNDDNVVVALTDLHIGDIVNDVLLLNDVKKGHKIAIRDISENSDVIKYGYSIGKAIKDIKKGEHVHSHNLKTNLSDIIEYRYDQVENKVKKITDNKTVNVYKRQNGLVGIRNELWIVPTVGCINNQTKLIIEEFKKNYDTSLIDGIYAYPHPYGCSQLGGDHEFTKKTLQNIIRHPNAGGVLVLGLGCENNQLRTLKEGLTEIDETRVRYLVAQEVEDEVKEGVKLLKELYDNMKDDKRVSMPISCLRIGLKCGGSDGFSGISANPLVGLFSDYLIARGGTTVLSEVPEMFGAETILMNHAKNEQVYNKIVKLINDFKIYYKKHDQVIYENPSVGNKEGGITTLEEKSLGCTQKAGNSEVVDVLFDNDLIQINGLNLLKGPGNDMVAVTNLGACGCHLVLFTTGRGTPFGGFVPTIKIATNNDLASRKSNWIDFNAGSVLTNKSWTNLLDEFVEYVIKVVNGEKTINEINNFKEIAIFKDGVTL
jgi:altronate hydrolase